MFYVYALVVWVAACPLVAQKVVWWAWVAGAPFLGMLIGLHVALPRAITDGALIVFVVLLLAVVAGVVVLWRSLRSHGGWWVVQFHEPPELEPRKREVLRVTAEVIRRQPAGAQRRAIEPGRVVAGEVISRSEKVKHGNSV